MLIKTGNCFHTLAQFVSVSHDQNIKFSLGQKKLLDNTGKNERKLTFSDVYLIQFLLRSEAMLQ